MAKYTMRLEPPYEMNGSGRPVTGMMFGALAWSGWLFAEIRYGLMCLLLLAPLAACALGLISQLPRSNLFLCMLWDFFAAASIAVPVAAIAAIKYAEAMAEFEGY